MCTKDEKNKSRAIDICYKGGSVPNAQNVIKIAIYGLKTKYFYQQLRWSHGLIQPNVIVNVHTIKHYNC